MLISPLSPPVPFFFLFVKHNELAYFYYNKKKGSIISGLPVTLNY